MRKIYIFLTVDIRLTGGIQLYTANKADFLEKQGFEVYTFFDGYVTGECAVPKLNAFTKYEIPGLRSLPYNGSETFRNLIINRMIRMLGNIENVDIIVESQDHDNAMWGELLAERIGGKHVCFLCNEDFQGANKHYIEKIDYYNFKLDNNELFAISEKALKNLFDGYRDIREPENHTFYALSDSPIADVECEQLNKINKADWTIAYVGRTDKNYVPLILDGIKQFADTYKDKSIQVVIVGGCNAIIERIEAIKTKCDNISFVCLGYMVPIPKKIYEKVDVVIAGAGCAFWSAYEGALTIVADAGNYLANGLLGYDTKSHIFHEEGIVQTDYFTALENVLVKKTYIGKTFDCAQNGRVFGDSNYKKQLDRIDITQKRYYNLEKMLEKAGDSIPRGTYLKAFIPRLALAIRKLRK